MIQADTMLKILHVINDLTDSCSLCASLQIQWQAVYGVSVRTFDVYLFLRETRSRSLLRSHACFGAPRPHVVLRHKCFVSNDRQGSDIAIESFGPSISNYLRRNVTALLEP